MSRQEFHDVPPVAAPLESVVMPRTAYTTMVARSYDTRLPPTQVCDGGRFFHVSFQPDASTESSPLPTTDDSLPALPGTLVETSHDGIDFCVRAIRVLAEPQAPRLSRIHKALGGLFAPYWMRDPECIKLSFWNIEG